MGKTIVEQSDVSLEHARSLLLSDGTFIYLERDEDARTVKLYVFDVVSEIEDWHDFASVQEFSGSNFGTVGVDFDWYAYTCALCEYHGAYNWGYHPDIYDEEAPLEEVIEEILSN